MIQLFKSPFQSLLFIPFLVFLACSKPEKVQDSNGFFIDGKVEKVSENAFIFLKINKEDGGFQVIDSTMPDEEGKFSFAGKPDSNSLYVIDLFGKQNVPVFLNRGKIEVKASGVSKGPYKVTGSRVSDVFALIDSSKKAFDANTKQLEGLYYKLIASKNKDAALGLASKYDSLQGKYKAFIKSVLLSNEPSPATLLGVDIFSIDQDFSFLDSLEQKFIAVAPNGYFTKKLSEMLAGPRSIAVGKPLPDLALGQPNGQLLSIKSFEGKVVVVDFWASWCGPCRQENPNLVRIYNELHSKGLEVVGVSLDTNKDKWLAAIEKDKLSWSHISDLKGWQSEAVGKFMISGIPLTIVVDRNGNIAAKGLRGAELEAKLKALLAS